MVAVNVSPAEAHAPEFAPALARLLDRHKIDGTALELEITEGMLMDHTTPPVRAFLAACSDRNIRLAIDDFGTGYSSLAYLRKLPIAKIKIDRSFTMHLCDPEGAALVEAMIEMARRLGKRVVAEGVETGKQLQYLRRLGCDAVQGHYLHEPARAHDLAKVFARRAPHLSVQ